MQSTGGMISKMVDFLHVSTTKSTNADVLAAFEESSDLRPILADYQTAGRGRLGRVWYSDPTGPESRDPGSGIGGATGPDATSEADSRAAAMLGSIPQRWALREAARGLVPFAAGLATLDAIGEFLPESRGANSPQVFLGWPNDVIVRRDGRWRKVAGILVESVPLDDRSLGVVVGVGINLDPLVQATDPAVLERAISLAEIGAEGVASTEIFAALIVHLETRTAELRSRQSLFMETYRQRCATIGEPVEVQLSDGPLIGTAADVADSGELVVLETSGRTHHVSVGDVVIRPQRGNG